MAILDFNNSENPAVDAVQATLLDRLVIPAAREYGLEAEYEYLRPSIKAFPTGMKGARVNAWTPASRGRALLVGWADACGLQGRGKRRWRGKRASRTRCTTRSRSG